MQKRLLQILGILAFVVSAPAVSSASALHTVAFRPTGPSIPSGGWKVEYANAFGGCIPGATCKLSGAPIDKSLTASSGKPSNTDEMTWYVPSQNVINSTGLHQICTYSPEISTGKNYACGELTSFGSSQWGFDPGQGQTWAFQVIAKLPPTTGEEDPAYWFTDLPWTSEIDAPEWWGYRTGTAGENWLKARDGFGFPAITRINDSGSPSGICFEYFGQGNANFAPNAAYHTYTVEMIRSTFYSWIDGKPECVRKTVGLVGRWAHVWEKVLLQHSLRDVTTGNPSPYFTSGSRSFDVRSIAVYEDANAHGAMTQHGRIIAPGTTIMRRKR